MFLRRGGGNTITYTTESTATITDSFVGDTNRVSINFNKKRTSFYGGLAPERVLYQAPSWTAAQKAQVIQAVLGAVRKIEKALVVLSDPQALEAFVQKNPVGIVANKLKDPAFVRNMLQYLINLKQGLQNGTINVFIDTQYNSADEPSLKMDLTILQGIPALFQGPYYTSYEPIHVNPSFFNLAPHQQVADMAHELGRYFGGITSGNEYGADMKNFDIVLMHMEGEYNKTHGVGPTRQGSS